MTIDINYFKQKLEEEKKLLEEELSSIGRKNPDTAGDWEATSEKYDAGQEADENVKADRFEELEERSGIGAELEEQLLNVARAIKKIESGAYGMCEISGEAIEEDRLRANPSARTCKQHINDGISGNHIHRH